MPAWSTWLLEMDTLRRWLMAEPANNEKPIVRYSDLARSAVNGRRNGVHEAPLRETDGMTFRDATQLKSLARTVPPQSTNSDLAIDRHTAQLFEHIDREITVVYASVRSGQPFRLDRVFGLAETMVDHSAPDQLLSQLFSEGRKSHYAILNSAHCAILAVRLASGLGHPRDERVHVAVAAMLHDIGMQTLPSELLDTPGRLSQEQVAVMQTHPEAGARLLTLSAPQHPWLAVIVREEHEREAGQGYPNGLRAAEIHELAKIIGVADIYDALISPRPYRRTFSPHEAVQELLDCQERQGYPKAVVRTLIQQLSLFPAGCRVRLSSNEVGRVIRCNSQSPLRPVVEVLYDADGQVIRPSRHIDLNINPLLYVTASLSLEHRTSVPSEEDGRQV
jgi:HD-GYP domain-containing protein (c-di-GMP phosphodiesterase class II)